MLWRLLRSAIAPSRTAAHEVQRALGLTRAGRQVEAEQLLRAAVRQYPDDAAAATNLAVVLLDQDRAQEAVPLLQRALEIAPRFAPALFNYAHILRFSGRLAEAISHYEAATVEDPSFAPAYEALMQALLDACDWDGAERLGDELRRRAEHDAPETWMPFVSPLTAIFLGLDAERCKATAAFHAPKPAPRNRPSLLRPRRAEDNRRLRVAYLSRDFRDHATSQLLGGALGLHDRTRFEVHAYSFGVDDGSSYRQGIIGSVDSFTDIAHMSDDEAATLIADARIDVLLDLAGHTTGNRLGILARRCAPVQAHYLGYPGTLGASYVDYFIGDPIASPPELDVQFTERVIRVPDCYQLNDCAAAFAIAPARRAEHDLPDEAFVFCNFASASRIDRRTFGLWMRILHAAPGSLLWLLHPSAATIENMSREATRRGVDPKRLVFGDFREKNAHLARLACADLALDTLEWCNGHTTTSDVLWAGVPTLTSPGQTFATRVAASLVLNAGLPELVVDSDDAYCTRAIELAHDRAGTAALRHRLRAARGSAPLFDTTGLVRGLEDAYEAMYAARIRPPAGL
ncbi:MAG TPA: tetratricopeptide repeat protein [Burkholderiales bacterium]|nr:tetratricopeptide repeat protein [Burkholderiales bacterium]